ncbi:MAG: protein BatD [Saprospiraceae bacterium]|nr:protein BatD [Saprospiraceae bacterium]
MASDKDVVTTGEAFMLQVVLENIEGSNMKLPDISPFKILQGPSTSNQMSIINGARSSSISYQYLISAPAAGKYALGPATIKAGGKVLKSNILNIEVVLTKPTKNISGLDTSKETLIRLEVSDDNAYIGQQIVVNYVLYTRQNIESYELLNEPDYEGFYAQPVQDIKEQPQRKTINGKEYHRQVLRKTILFPQKVGKYTFGPVNCTLDIPVDGGSSFFFRDVRKEQTTTNAISVNVRPLPEPAPSSFTGAVGMFDMKANIVKSTVVVGEAITIQMEITGDGDTKIVQPPKSELIPGLEAYEPSIIRDETFSRSDKINMLKTFEFLFVASKDTIYNIKTDFTYFSPDKGKYETISSGPFTVTVLKASGVVNPPDNSSPASDLLSPMSQENKLDESGRPFFASTKYFMILSAILLFTAFGVVFQKRRLSKEEAQAISESSSKV